MTKTVHLWRWLLLVGCAGPTALAQWSTQTIELHPGWNAVFVEIQPEPKQCDVVLAGLPVESVWAWNRRFSSVQFIQDPTTLVVGQPDWLTWLPATHPGRAAVNLFTLEGGRAYLIQLEANAGAVNWQIRGQAVIRRIEWLSDAFNLVGFQVQSQNPPTFQRFFEGSGAHVGQPIYRLSAAGRWEQILNPATATMKSGECFWIRSQGRSTYSGPLNVEPEQGTRLDYGRILTELRLRIRNDSASPRSIALKPLPSAPPPANSDPALAGAVPLSYFKMDLANNQYGWVPLPSQLDNLDLAPGQEWELRLAVRRVDMAEFNLPPGSNDALYQSLLEATDNFGARWLIPVTARGLQSFGPQSPSVSLAGQGLQTVHDPPHKRAGLWVGQAVVNRVNQPASISQPDVPVATASEFRFRLLVHVDGQGQARLLQKVLQMWKNGTTKPDPTDATKKIVDQPGRFVLLTDDSLVPNFSGAALRDGQPVGRRLSSTAFAFRNPILMTGAGEFGLNKVSFTVSLDYDDPLNPFKHKYHPDHNNLDERYEKKLPEGIESFSVIREITLEFQATDPEGLALAGWGDNQLGGTYREKISGLHQKTLFFEGTFRLHQVSRIPVLNDQL